MYKEKSYVRIHTCGELVMQRDTGAWTGPLLKREFFSANGQPVSKCPGCGERLKVHDLREVRTQKKVLSG